MKILLTGATGLIGTALRNAFERGGDSVVAIPRAYGGDFDFSGADAVIHLAGESIANGRWTAEKKQRIEESRVGGTSRISERIVAAKNKPKVFISASAIGYYGNRGDEALTEKSPVGSGFLSAVCQKWENATACAIEAGIRTVHLRTGIVLSSAGGALKKMLPPFKLGAGGIMGNGDQFMSWISISDVVGIIRFLIVNDQLSGPVNVVSPNPLTNREFTKTLGTVLHRPTVMPLPAMAARFLFGETADALLLSSTRVLPEKLLAGGYVFRHPFLKPALEHILS